MTCLTSILPKEIIPLKIFFSSLDVSLLSVKLNASESLSTDKLGFLNTNLSCMNLVILLIGIVMKKNKYLSKI